MTADELALLRRVAVGGSIDIEDEDALPPAEAGADVEIRVSGCAYSCCGKGWIRRDGYEQIYVGYVDNLSEESFMLYNRGIGTVSYIVAVLMHEVYEVTLR